MAAHARPAPPLPAGLIHFAVAFYHLERRNPPGAERQLRKGLRKMAALCSAI